MTRQHVSERTLITNVEALRIFSGAKTLTIVHYRRLAGGILKDGVHPDHGVPLSVVDSGDDYVSVVGNRKRISIGARTVVHLEGDTYIISSLRFPQPHTIVESEFTYVIN